MVLGRLCRDLTGKKEYKQMVKSLYEGADIVLIFFSVVDASSYASAIEQVRVVLSSGTSRSAWPLAKL